VRGGVAADRPSVRRLTRPAADRHPQGRRPALATQRQGKEGTPRYAQAQDVEKQALALLEEHRVDALRLGALGRLPGSAAVEVLPLDDARLLDEAKPVRGGKVQADAGKVEARHDFQVRSALKSGPCSLLVLGGGHDLGAAVRRLGGGDMEYLRVLTRRYTQFAGEGDK